MSRVRVLDGPMGTELERRGVATPLPLWTAAAVADAPDAVRAIHAEYAAAGADVHTAATFRTRPRALRGTRWETRWRELTASAVALAREGAGPDAVVAGSIAPLEDCFTPEATPDDARLEPEHTEMARCLADAGADLLLVETMPTLREFVAATRAAVSTGLPTWAAVTLGPRGDYFPDDALREARAAALELGAEMFLLNCSTPDLVTRALETLGPPRARLRHGAYANDLFDDEQEWTAERYAAEAVRWLDLGAEAVGGCCGTTPAHTRALRALVDARA